jgi:hypothetical protein
MTGTNTQNGLSFVYPRGKAIIATESGKKKNIIASRCRTYFVLLWEKQKKKAKHRKQLPRHSTSFVSCSCIILHCHGTSSLPVITTSREHSTIITTISTYDSSPSAD